MAPRDDGSEGTRDTTKGPEHSDTGRDPSVDQLIRKAQLAALVAAMRAADIHLDALRAAYEEAAERDDADPAPRPGGTDDQSPRPGHLSTALACILGAAGLSSMDVSEAAFLVMMMATKDMDDDIREIMAEIKAMTAAKRKLRELISELNRWISQEMSKRRESENLGLEEATGSSPGGLFEVGDNEITYNEPRPDVESPDLVAEQEVTYNLGDGEPTIQSLKSLQDDLKAKLDGMNEMSEMTSLRLQMTMDRRSKFITTLSSMMKKISTTQDILVQNIK